MTPSAIFRRPFRGQPRASSEALASPGPIGAPFDRMRLVRSFASVSALYLVGVPLALAVNIVLARVLSMADFGLYSFAIATATVLSIPVSSGLPLLLTREVASYVQRQDWPRYRALLRSAHLWVVLNSLAVLGLFFAARWAFGDGDDAARWSALSIGVVLVPILGLASVRGGVLKGLMRPVLSDLPSQVLLPSLTLAGVVVLGYLGPVTMRDALLWYLAASALTLLVATVVYVRAQPAGPRSVVANPDEAGRWVRSLLPFAALGAITTMLGQVAVMLLGFSGQETAVAAMRVAERAALLTMFPLHFINSILGPHLVGALRASDPGELKRLTRFSARLTTGVALPGALLLILFGRSLIALVFGPDYVEPAYPPLVILLVSQLVAISTGSSGLLLAMNGKESLSLLGQVIALVVLAATAGLLVQSHGAVGAALGVAAGTLTSSLFTMVAVRRTLRIWPGLL